MEGGLNYAHLFPRVSRYKRGSDIVDVRVYMKLTKIIYSNTLMSRVAFGWSFVIT
jgi:hypothetical protein